MAASQGTNRQLSLDFLRKPSLARSEALTGFAFLSPWILGFLAFTFVPMVLTLLMTFSNFRLVQAEPLQFIGLANYAKLLNDPQMRQALLVTVRFGLIALPLGLLVPIGLAALINNKKLWGRGIFYT